MANKSASQYMWKIPKTYGHSPCARWGHTANMIMNYKQNPTLLIFGGWDGQNMLSDCQLFDLVENEWMEVPKMNGKIPTPRAGHSSTVISNLGRNEILLLGGGNGQHYLSMARNDVHILNIDSMTWRQPQVSSQVKVYIKDDLIVNEQLINEVSTDIPTSPSNENEEEIPVLIGTQTAEITDTGFGTPSQRASLHIASSPIVTTVKEVYPAPRSRHTAILVQRTEKEPLRIILFGGGGKNKIFDDLWILNVDKMEWYQPHNMSGTKPSPRWGHTANLIGDKMYVFGGVYDSKMMNDLYELDTNTYQWKQIIFSKTAPIPAPRAAHTVTAVHGRYLFILWGGDDDRFLDDLFVYDLQKNVGKRLTFKTPKARCAHSALLWDRDNGNGAAPLIYVFGGGNGSIRFKELYMLDTEIAIKKSGFEVPSRTPVVIPPPILQPTNDVKMTEKLVTSPTTSRQVDPVIEKQSMIRELQDDITSTQAPAPSSRSSSTTSYPPPPPPPLPTPPRGNNNYMYVRTEIKVDDSVNYPVNRGLHKPPPPSLPHHYNRIYLPQPPPPPPPPQVPQITRSKRRRNSSRKSSDVYTTKDAKEVTNWLVSLGLGRYAGMFVHEEIDMECLPLLAEADLFRIGVSKYGPRKKILAAAREIEQEISPDEEDSGQSSAPNTDREEGEQNFEPSSPPPSNTLHRQTKKNGQMIGLEQLTQSVNNLAMTCEGLKDVVKNMCVIMQMMMVNQQQLQQQQMQQHFMMMNPMAYQPPPPPSDTTSPRSLHVVQQQQTQIQTSPAIQVQQQQVQIQQQYEQYDSYDGEPSSPHNHNGNGVLPFNNKKGKQKVRRKVQKQQQTEDGDLQVSDLEKELLQLRGARQRSGSWFELSKQDEEEEERNRIR